MKLTRSCIKLIMFLYCLVKFRSYKMAYTLSFHNVSLKNIQSLSRENDKVVFNRTGNKIYASHLAAFEFSINNLVDLLQNTKVKVEGALPGKFIVSINGLRFNVASLSNMAVLYEVFIEEIYAVELKGENLLVIDIGMNVGVASQYFAQMPGVKAVYGYEPFPETCQEAVENVKMNAAISDKIVCNSYGVSNVSEVREISLFDSGLLSASTIENADNTYGRSATRTVTVQLKSITEIFDELFPQFPNSPVLLKIDCEGEEYAIFDCLKDTQYLDKVTCVLIEWHEKGAAPIAEVLKQHNFQMLHLPHATANCGMIYGFRSI